jgi:pantoate--beta-alanine ligase
MKVVETVAEMRALRAALARPFGLVPTMGYLHDGHLSLVRRAKAECASVGVSIFVNPTQFGPTEDLQSYPRDLPHDRGMLEAEGVDVLWMPSTAEMYPTGFQTWVTVEELARPLEGARRPGHFRGVATVVAKLLHVAQPERAYFGQKDAQQAIVVRRMVADLEFPIDVVVCPTVREADGLALSSRNVYLSTEERRAATVLFRALCAAQELFARGEQQADRLRSQMQEILAGEPLARPIYVSVAAPTTLEELKGKTSHALLSMAVAIGKTVLIDNVVVGEAVS